MRFFSNRTFSIFFIFPFLLFVFFGCAALFYCSERTRFCFSTILFILVHTNLKQSLRVPLESYHLLCSTYKTLLFMVRETTIVAARCFPTPLPRKVKRNPGLASRLSRCVQPHDCLTCHLFNLYLRIDFQTY